ncbi:MAG: tetratricopeptide repeat protein [Gammaproteobacteria bacterium]|nr:tetratricopeptide repeat protein [Gammaproteobacteria bacterium]MYB36183.1 tetratricopeptide repeat protein [Gammaproteobacteria bacterium]
MRAAGLALATALAVGFVGCGVDEGAAPPDAAVAHNDRGVALMGRYQYAEAEGAFVAALALAPDWLDARVNQAIATLNRQEEGDERLTLSILREVLDTEPNHLRALYTSGIVHLYLGEAEAAQAMLQRAAAGDPRDAYASYFLGQALLQQGDHAAAAPLFLRAAELDPYLRSAYWAGAQALRRVGREEDAAELLASYQRFEAHPAARLAAFSYMRMGPKAEARAVSVKEREPSAVREGAVFSDPVPLDQSDWTDAALSVADIDNDGRLDLLVNAPDRTRVYLGTNQNRLVAAANHPLHDSPPARAALWGDVDNDGLIDVVLCSGEGVRLWQQAPVGEWHEALAHTALPCSDGALFDADHDGDLDIFFTGEEGNELLSNNLDGTFRPLAADYGLRGSPGRHVLATDLDADRDLDIAVLNQAPPHDIWRNDRTWRYEPMPGFDELRATELAALAVADADANGRPELYGVTASGQVQAWVWNLNADSEPIWSRQLLAQTQRPAHAIDVADFDGDATPELLLAGSDGFLLLRTGTGAVQHVEDAPTSALTRTLMQPANGPALVSASAAGLHLWRAGPGRHAFLTLSPTGRSEADQMRSNASGIGTHARVRFAGDWAVLDALDANSAPGQSLMPLSIGLDGFEQADFVSLLWSDGVSQSELDLAVGTVHAIPETQRQLASCPVLFAWNGTEHAFVSDMLGVAAMGLFSSPGETVPARPFERFLLTAEQLAAKDGRYQIKLGEPMEETAYIDAARLHVYDLPPGWGIVLDERLATAEPAATGRPITWRLDEAQVPIQATDADGNDVTAIATLADRRAPPIERDPRFIGLLKREQRLTLEFDAPLPRQDAVLVADAWMEYPYSQTVFAAWQAGLAYQPPSLEARDGEGTWHSIAPAFGYPAGMPRKMALPLPKLPRGTNALRLSSNMEIYWDKVQVVREQRLPELSPVALAPVAARVARSGFAQRTTGEQRLPHYDYGERATYWDAKLARGYYTAIGSATELVREEDGALAIFGSGEEVHVEFAELPPPPQNTTRWFAVEFRGWARDMDLYTQHGDTVAPLPVPVGLDETGIAKRDALHARYNVRFQEGL